MTVDTGRLSCGFDSGTASDGTLNMRMLCTDPGKKQPSIYGAQLKLRPGQEDRTHHRADALSSDAITWCFHPRDMHIAG